MPARTATLTDWSPARRHAQERPPESGPVRVLLVESEAEISHGLVLELGSEGMDIGVCTDSAQALLRIGMASPDILVVGADVPGLPLEALIGAVRAVLDIPVVIGVRDHDADRAALALGAGATACVARPYRVSELAAMIHAARPGRAPRAKASAPDVVRAGILELDPHGYQLRVCGRSIDLALREFQLMKYLVDHAGLVVTREQIWREVWNRDQPLVNNTISVHIRRLRDKLRKTEAGHRYIHTIRGVGYRLDVDAA
ncbi:response regulator transcription factor [Nocardiopsis dassonvillei]